jgi:hypothetical protein
LNREINCAAFRTYRRSSPPRTVAAIADHQCENFAKLTISL